MIVQTRLDIDSGLCQVRTVVADTGQLTAESIQQLAPVLLQNIMEGAR